MADALPHLWRVTAQMLRAAGVCESALALFRAHFGGSVLVTPEAARVAIEIGLPLGWAAHRFLPAQAALEFDRAADDAAERLREVERMAHGAFQQAQVSARRDAVAKALSDHGQALKAPPGRTTTQRRIAKRASARLLASRLAAARLVPDGDPLRVARVARDRAIAAARAEHDDAVARVFAELLAKREAAAP